MRNDKRAISGNIDEAHNAAHDWLTLTSHVMDSLHYGLVVTNAKRVILRTNPSFCRITGYAAEEAIGKTPSFSRSGRHTQDFYDALNARLNEQGCWSGETWNRHKNGQLYLAWLDIRQLPADMPLGARYVGVLSDITERYLEAERMRHSALHDTLTGLANRSLLRDRALHESSRAQRSGSIFACIFIDLDGFKPINDTFGHETGDRVLCEIADRLRGVFRADDTLARFGGDEFIAITPGIADRHSALALAGKALEAFNRPLIIDGQTLPIGASIGISLYPDDGHSFEQLVANADAAMYLAKKAGGNQACFHEAALNNKADERKQMEMRLRQAIDCGEFELWFQPKFDLADRQIIGGEALLRWNHPERGLLTAHEFIPAAENCGLTLPLGDWVLRDACRVLQYIHQRGHAYFSMAVNVSPRQIAREDFICEVAAALSGSSANAGHLQLEITESALLRDPDGVTRVVKQLTDIGVSMTLDNFGSGQSNFSSLKQLPFETLKVDRKFIDDVHANRYNGSFTRAAVELANGLNMKLVADGVENHQQADYLKEIGCHQAQGYLFGRPMPEVELLALLEADAQSREH